MTSNDFTTIITSCFSILNEVITKFKNDKSDPFIALDNKRKAESLETLRNNISLMQKYNTFSFPDYYSSEEREIIFEKMSIIESYLSVLKNSLFNDELFNKIENENDALIKYTRISRLIKETQDQEKLTDKFRVEMLDEIEKIKSLKNDSEIKLSRINSIITTSSDANNKTIELVNELKEEIESAKNKKDDIHSILLKSNAIYSNIEIINQNLEQAGAKLNDIINKNNKSEEHLNKLIDEADHQIEFVLTKTDKINNLNKSLSDQTIVAKELIDKAKSALNLAGTYRLSRHFKNAYDLANKNKLFWAITSIFSALVCIAFIVYMLFEMNKITELSESQNNTHLILLFFARLSMIPILLGFFAFSAVQYVKQNNISEDYAHKKLLSETLISFKQEVINNDTDKASLFMDSILKTVLRSPLSVNDKKNHLSEMEKINNLITTTTEINKEIIDKLYPSQGKGKKEE